MRLLRINRFNPGDTVYYLSEGKIYKGMVVTAILRLNEPVNYEISSREYDTFAILEKELFPSLSAARKAIPLEE